MVEVFDEMKEEEVNKSFKRYVALICLLGLGGCSTASTENSALESYNHAMFRFNNTLEKTVIRPVAKGYRAVTNKYIRKRVTNFFDNVEEPISMANHLLQGDIHSSAENLARFMINTTIGGLGLYDVAAKAGLGKNATGFDETMATWCVPDGPYLVLPVMGPSTPRATAGWVADGYSSPTYWIANESSDKHADSIYYGVSSLKYLNKYAENLKLIEGLEESSVDYYETIKSAYLQNRGKIKVCGKAKEPSASSYDFDMDEE